MARGNQLERQWRLLELIDRPSGATVAAGAKLQQPTVELLTLIQRAIVDRRSLRIRHHSLERDESTTRTVDPYHLTYRNGGLYLIGHCHLRNDLRVFALDRIREASVLALRFERPARFDPEEYLRDAWGIVRGSLVTVRVVFTEVVARSGARALTVADTRPRRPSIAAPALRSASNLDAA